MFDKLQIFLDVMKEKNYVLRQVTTFFLEAVKLKLEPWNVSHQLNVFSRMSMSKTLWLMANSCHTHQPVAYTITYISGLRLPHSVAGF